MAKYYKNVNRRSIMEGQILIEIGTSSYGFVRVTAATHKGEKILRMRTASCRGWSTNAVNLELLNMDEVS
jgi:hypothetical protein